MNQSGIFGSLIFGDGLFGANRGAVRTWEEICDNINEWTSVSANGSNWNNQQADGGEWKKILADDIALTKCRRR